MTAESALQNVLLEIGLDSIDAQISSERFKHRQILAFMNVAGDDIARRVEWSRLYVDWTISGNIAAIDLPDDFYEMSEQGSARLNGTGYTPIRAVVAPEQWGFLTARPSKQRYYHLCGGQLLFSPELPPEGAKVRYVSKNWVEDRAQIEQNGDNIHIPERLIVKGTIWRWKRQNGLPFDDVLAEFEADLIAEIKADRGEA